jgi:phosphotransferase system enzyme I (PtsP)
LLGDTVSITEIAAVPIDRLAGIVSMRGSALSHTGILARALGIPAVVSLTALPMGRLDSCEMVVDGDQGRIYIRPSRAVIGAFQRHIGEAQAPAAHLQSLRGVPAETPDGVRLPLYVNIGLIAELTPSLIGEGEGVGLFRTEFLFLTRESFPVEDEQYQIYRKVLESFAPKPVTLRTLDMDGFAIHRLLSGALEEVGLGVLVGAHG